MATEKSGTCLVIHLCNEGPQQEIKTDDLLKYTRNLRFLGYGPAISPDASVVVRYGSYTKDSGFLPGFGSFGK